MDQAAQPSPSPHAAPMVHIYDDELTNAKRATGAFSLNDIRPGALPWLWAGRIPLGSVTLLVGDPGVGKSLLALDIAARVSRGTQWPDECSRHAGYPALLGGAVTEPDDQVRPPCRGGQVSSTDHSPTSAARLAAPTPPSAFHFPPSSVLLINAEDLVHNAIRPRLDALGADCSRIIAWAYVRGALLIDEPRLFGLTRDLNSLEQLLKAMQDCQLIFLDPITALLGDASEQTSGDVWKLLAALAALARKYKLAVLVVNHFRKREGAPIHRALGSLAFVAAARAVWAVVKDPADPTRRLFLPLKNNFAPETKGLAFTIETHEPTQAAVIRWHPKPIECTAEAAFISARPNGRPDDDREFAMNWLQERLASGPSLSRDVRKAADAN